MIFQTFKSRLGEYAKKCMVQKGAIQYQPRHVRLRQPAIHLFI